MKIIFADGEVQECDRSEKREVNVAEVVISPLRLPKNLNRVWQDPPTYTRLAKVRCNVIQAGHYVMTAKGLKRVSRVELQDAHVFRKDDPSTGRSV
jgi:hypothetical protein